MRPYLGKPWTQGEPQHDVSGVEETEVEVKKKSLHASERETPRVQERRREFGEWVKGLEFKRLKFIDESGVHLGMTRLYGRGEPGDRVVETKPGNPGTNLTVLAALGLEGAVATMTVDGPVDGEVFRIYVEQVLGPELKKGDVVVMDNLSVHKVSGIEALLLKRGAKLQYLPPYSPDLNPIEKCWSKLKTFLRKVKARSQEALNQALTEGFKTITRQDAQGWFRHCGYSIN
jgi:transposase